MRAIKPLMTIGAVSCLVLMSVKSPASEAVGRVLQIDGTALISEGGRFVPILEETFLKDGDRLFALEGGEALLVFADACQYRLGDDRVLDVTQQSPCEQGLGGEYRPELLTAVTTTLDGEEVLREAQSAVTGTGESVSATGSGSTRRLVGRVGAAGGPKTGAAGATVVAGTFGTGSLVGATVAVGLGLAGITGVVAAIENNSGGGGNDSPNPPLSQ